MLPLRPLPHNRFFQCLQVKRHDTNGSPPPYVVVGLADAVSGHNVGYRPTLHVRLVQDVVLERLRCRGGSRLAGWFQLFYGSDKNLA